MDDLRGIGYGSGHFQEDDEISGRRVRPGQGAPLPSGSVDISLFQADKWKIKGEYMESRIYVAGCQEFFFATMMME